MAYSEAVTIALSTILTPSGLLLIFLGTMLGLIFGALPGLGGAVAIAILIPITFPMEPMTAFMILASAQGGAAFGGSISAILLNIPGSAPNAATLLDGHPLAKQGRANYALGASAAASAMGAIVGLIILVLSIPVLRDILRAFGPPEFFAMAIFGLVILAVATRDSVVNGLIAGAIGLSLAFVGFNPVTGGARFTFGLPYLTDGVQLMPAIIGLFAIGEMLHLLSRRQTISSSVVESGVGDSVFKGVRAVFENFGVFLRSSLIGVVVGAVPAAGGTVANFIAYVQAMKTSDNNENFGKGDIRGVIASEASNDAKDGGAIIPTIAFGIPGSAAWAVMLGAFLLHGINPGPQLMNEHMDVVFVIIFALFLSNILTSTVGIAISRQLSKITVIPIEILAPIIFLISLLGAYTIRLTMLDMVAALVFGVFGYLMMKYGLSRIALIIGLVLGPIAERAFHQSLMISRGSYEIFYTRPMTLAIFSLLVLTLTYPLLKRRFDLFQTQPVD